MSDVLERRIAELEQQLNEGPASTDKSGNSNIYIIGIIIPIVVWLFLYFWKPSIVRDKEGDHEPRNTTKVFFYTVLITALAWGALYILKRYTPVFNGLTG